MYICVDITYIHTYVYIYIYMMHAYIDKHTYIQTGIIHTERYCGIPTFGT